VQLAERGCEVVMCCRNVEKAEKAREDVVKRSKADQSKVHVVQLDLADLDNVETFRSRYDATTGLANRPIDMLILNAGIMAVNTREVTKQGIESQMGTNVVGHFKFAACMFDLCKTASHSRIVVVSSGMHRFASTINLADFNREKSYAKWNVYEETKLGNMVFVAKLNRLLEEKNLANIVAVGCHPGYSSTNLQNNTIVQPLNMFFAQSASMGAKPTVLAATDPAAKRNGLCGPTYLFEMRGPPKWGCTVNKAVSKTKLQDDLWAKCEELTKCNFADKIAA